jgi:putative transposase
MTTPRDPIYAGHRYPAEIISYAVWLYFRFPLSLRMVEEMLAARGISVTHETIRQWGRHRQLGMCGLTESAMG